MKRILIGILFLAGCGILGMKLGKILPPPPVNSFVFGPNEAYAKTHPAKVQEGPCVGVVTRKSNGVIEVTVPAGCTMQVGDNVVLSDR